MKRIKGVFLRKGIAYVRYKDETGEIVRESTQQSNLKVAEDILAKRRTEVAMRRNFPARQFAGTRFGTLIDYWWTLHGQHTRSRFEYRLPRVRERFASLRATDITSDAIDEFLDRLEGDGLSA